MRNYYYLIHYCGVCLAVGIFFFILPRKGGHVMLQRGDRGVRSRWLGGGCPAAAGGNEGEAGAADRHNVQVRARVVVVVSYYSFCCVYCRVFGVGCVSVQRIRSGVPAAVYMEYHGVHHELHYTFCWRILLQYIRTFSRYLCPPLRLPSRPTY